MNVGALDIARWRLRTQHLVEPHARTAAEIVERLLAVQAENPAQSAWAVAARTAKPEAADLARLLDEGTIVRTHVLRPTWHYATADDVGWLIELTAPRIRRITQVQLRGEHGLDEDTLERASLTVLQALSSAHLTRTQLAQALGEAGIAVTGQSLMILLADLELQGLVCSGRTAGDGTHTYALFAERIPSPRRLDRDEALAEVALRYFVGHGPATERDLAYWASLTLGDVRRGLAQVTDRLDSFDYEGRTFWHAPADPPVAAGTPAGHLLQVLDETYRGYQDSRWVLDAAGIVPRQRESAIGMALVDAQLVAAMKRTVGTDRVTFELRPYRPLTGSDLAALDAAAARYGKFLGRTGVLDVR